MKRVLIVENEPTTGEIMSAMLRRADYSVIGQASDAESALKLCMEKNPDVVLWDIELQHGNNMNVATVIRSSQPDVVVVMVGGEAYAERARKAMQLGADGFVAKPFSSRRLIGEIYRARMRRD